MVKHSSMQTILAAGALLLAIGCEYHARSPEDYRGVTRELIQTRTGQIQTCYDTVLKSNKEASGSVTVHFFVQEDTGAFQNIEALPSSTAPEPLQQCVVTALEGLVLAPPDARKGDATFSFDFAAGKTKS